MSLSTRSAPEAGRGRAEMSYAAVHQFPVTPERLWDEIEQFECFESWWGWLERFHAEPPRLLPGTVLTGAVHPPLPYRMAVRVEMLECIRPRWIRASVAGDLRGTALLELVPVEVGTDAHVSWTLEMTQPAMQVAARLARPLLRWGHDRVVDATVAGFRRHLDES